MQHRTIRGRLAYVGPDGTERGREWFHVTCEQNGSRTMRSTCEIDDSQILRDVILTVGSDWRPRESYVRVCAQGALLGSAWFRFDEGSATAQISSESMGRVSQRVTTLGRTPMFGAHQVAGDGWQAGLLSPAANGPSRIEGILLCSALPNGASSPMITRTAMTAERLGTERITVPAGEFDTVHYRFSPDGLPPEDVWVLPDDLILVRSVWSHYSTSYVLSELEVREPSPTP